MKILLCIALIFWIAHAASPVIEIDNLIDSIHQGNSTFPWDIIFQLLEFCTVKDAVTGFFTGTELDPTVANSRCVTYYPILESHFNYVISSYNASIIYPSYFLGWVDSVASTITKYALWQNYCIFSTLLTRLDNTIVTLEGFTTLLYRVLLTHTGLFAKFNQVLEGFKNQQCFVMSEAAGEIASVMLDFHVPEDIV